MRLLQQRSVRLFSEYASSTLENPIHLVSMYGKFECKIKTCEYQSGNVCHLLSLFHFADSHVDEIDPVSISELKRQILLVLSCHDLMSAGLYFTFHDLGYALVVF